MAACTLCPRRCGTDRTRTAGRCHAGASVRVARAAPHFWEEPPISGQRGSGAVFFSGCSLGCRFCQNKPLSADGFGADISVARLRDIFRELVDAGCHNINLVTGTQFLPQILEALDPKPPVPIIWNTGGYETIESLRMLDGVVDIYLPDFKYSDPALAATLSAAPDYPEVAKSAISEMFRQTGRPIYAEDGMLLRGTMVRHLILPDCVDNSLQVISWLADSFPNDCVPLSLMSQYVPMAGMEPPFDRRITETEYAAVCSWAELCGIQTGYLQEFSSAEEKYIPDFSLQGVLPS